LNGNPKRMNGLRVYDDFCRISTLAGNELARTVCRVETPAPISGLDNRAFPAKNTANSGCETLSVTQAAELRLEPMIPFRPSMTPSRSPQPPETSSGAVPCKHPRVRVVAREEDAEFVECLECGEVFDSSEFKDMGIEESKVEES